MAQRGVWQLRHLKIAYCSHGGSSRGVRAFLVNQLPHVKEMTPNLEIDVTHRPAKHPYVMGKYANGVTKQIGLKNLDADTVLKQVLFLRNQTGRRHVKLHDQQSKTMSVQGVWTPELQRLVSAEAALETSKETD